MNNQSFPQGQNPTGYSMGTTGSPQGGHSQQGQKIGAHELLMAHEVLSGMTNGMNSFELYQPHITDSQLLGIWQNQLHFMQSSYQNIVNYLHNRGGNQAVPYRTPRPVNPMYGLRNPSPQHPNNNMNQIDDRDVASGMMGCAKSAALQCTWAALECADPNLRNLLAGCAQSAINRAYEIFQYMNQKGMYQVPTLADNTTNTMIHSYQAAPTMPMQ